MTLSFFKLYLTSKIEQLDKRAAVLHSVNDMSELAGKLELRVVKDGELMKQVWLLHQGMVMVDIHLRLLGRIMDTLWE
jgi:hypothetical protein